MCEISNDLKCMTFSKNDISRIENESYNKALENLVKLVCKYYTMQEKSGYCADTNNMIKQRIADFAEQLKKGEKQ